MTAGGGNTHVDGALLVDPWDDLVLPADIRQAWQELIDGELSHA